MGLSDLGCESSSRPSPTRGADESSPSTGPESPATRTYETFNWQTGGDFRLGMGDTPTALQKQQVPAVLISSQAGSRVRTSVSPDAVPDSPASDPACSSSSPGLPMTLFGTEDGSSLRTFPDFFPQTPDAISLSYSRRWPTSGFTTSLGECWTADTSECPSDGDASSSLADVLLETVPERFFLSPRAAAGILRRAEKRGRELPRALAEALTALASQRQDDGRKTTRTSSTLSTARPEGPMTTAPRQDTLSPTLCAPTERPEGVTTSNHSPSLPPSSSGTAREPTPTLPTLSSPTRSAPKGSTPARTEPDEEPRIVLGEQQAGGRGERHRDEREGRRGQAGPVVSGSADRLDGAPTDPNGVRTPPGLPRRVDDPQPDGPRYAATGNAVTVNVIEWIGRRIVSYEASASSGVGAKGERMREVDA